MAVVVLFVVMVLVLLVLCVALAWQLYGRDIRAYQYINSLDSVRQEATSTPRRHSFNETDEAACKLRQRMAWANTPQTKELLQELDRMK